MYCHRGPELAARYWADFGDLELVWLHAQAGKTPAGHNARLAAGRRHCRQAGRHLARGVLDGQQAGQLLADYYSLVRGMHPQLLGPNASPADGDAWPTIQRAFRTGDAITLRAYAEQFAVAKTDSLVLPAEYARLQTALEAVRQRRADMRQRFPFNLQGKLDDPRWIASQRARMRSQLVDVPFAGAQQARVAVS